MNERVGFTCTYAPLPLIHAAGFIPFRILPLGDAPDQAGSLLHDNLCPHVKRVLDRGLAADLPELSGVVFVNSCDAMRRLADAWEFARPSDRTVLMDLPSTNDDRGVSYLATELARLTDHLAEWAGRQITAERVAESARLYRDLSRSLTRLGRASRERNPARWKARGPGSSQPLGDHAARRNRWPSSAGSKRYPSGSNPPAPCYRSTSSATSSPIQMPSTSSKAAAPRW